MLYLILASLALTSAAVPTTNPSSATAVAVQASQGLSIDQVSTYLTSQGLNVGPVTQGPNPYFQVRDGEYLAFTVTFFSCQQQVCGDVQFGAGFSNPTTTLEVVNSWNKERRFTRAYYETAVAGREYGAALLQYDVVVTPTQGVEQLAAPLAIWRSQLPAFARHVGYFTSN